ncbi:hypothetical protein D3C76_1633960 [compost metagenome]
MRFAVRIFGCVIIIFTRRNDFTRNRGFWFIISKHANLYLTRIHKLLNNNFGIIAESKINGFYKTILIGSLRNTYT